MELSVKSLFKDVAVGIGFRKKGDYYYKPTKDLVHVVGVRKSKWGNCYSIWFGVSIRAITDLEYPPLHKCHVQCSAESFVDNKNELAAALDEEDYWKMDAEGRREIIKLALTSGLFYFFNQADSLDKLRQYLVNKNNTMLAVNGNAKEFLHIPK